MAIENFDGIVLKEEGNGEAGKIVTVFAKGLGKVRIGLKGAKSAKSKLAAPSQLFCYSTFQGFKNRNMYNASTAEVIESFYDIRADIKKFAYACFFLELIEKNVQDGQANDELLYMLLITLAVISKTDYDERLAAVIFESKLLNLNGYFSQPRRCTACGKIIDGDVYFDHENNSFKCFDCIKSGRGEKLIAGTVSAFEYIFANSGKKMFSFRVSEEVLKQMESILIRMIKENMVMAENSYEFLKTVK